MSEFAIESYSGFDSREFSTVVASRNSHLNWRQFVNSSPRGMPKMPKTKFYAVRNGRKGAEIYTSWDEVSSRNECKFTGNSDRSSLYYTEVTRPRRTLVCSHNHYNQRVGVHFKQDDFQEPYTRAFPLFNKQNNGYELIQNYRTRVSVTSIDTA